MIYIVLALFACVLLVLFFFRRGNKRHAFKRKQAKKVYRLLTSLEHDGACLAYLRKIDPYSFEELLLDAFERRGFKVKRSASYSGDGGIDGRVMISGHEFLVQAKRYSGHIQKAHVTSFHQICKNENTYGLFLHTGRTGEQSKDLHFDDIAILSGSKLLCLIKTKEPVNVLLNRRHYVVL
jgi:restriction system protein